MENLIFSLNATIPVFLMMILGIVFRKLGIVDEQFATKLNQFVFKVSLPLLVFKDLATVNLYESLDIEFVLFCFLATVGSILIAFIISLWFKDDQGEFIQASYRSSAALLGMALINNIYGESVMGPLMIIGAVPLYNAAAVVILNLFKEEQTLDINTIKNTLINIAKNPIIIGIFAGILYSLLRLPYPYILSKSVSSLGATASPLGLIAMGALFDIKSSISKMKPAIVASFMKLIGFGMIFIPLAVKLGFRNDGLVAILIMLTSASTVSCYTMAKSMGHDGIITTNIVMITTLLCGFTITAWLFVLKSFMLI